ncbi:MAG TPA: helix-turn-helix domain-containing protein [Puia sp.]|jgi:predicted DNA-binding transcriptional regulator AlpA|nr:helix-turn-helix domain-containing protein [Puia sp.]
MIPQEDIFNEKEIAKIAGISRSTIWRMKRDGQLKPSINVRSKSLYTTSDLEKAFIKKSKDKNGR